VKPAMHCRCHSAGALLAILLAIVALAPLLTL
jgi:hypothetical protein